MFRLIHLYSLQESSRTANVGHYACPDVSAEVQGTREWQPLRLLLSTVKRALLSP